MSKKLPFLLIIFIIFLTGYFIGQGSVCTDSGDNSNLNINDSNNLSPVKNKTNTKVKNSSNYELEGTCNYVVDGDTIDVESVGRIRFVGVNTPERGENGYKSAKEYVKSKCLGKTVYLDVDDKKNKDKYGRILAVVYINTGQNLNQLLLKGNYAEVMYIPPSEFYPYDWQ